jgi:hypothetical protein
MERMKRIGSLLLKTSIVCTTTTFSYPCRMPELCITKAFTTNLQGRKLTGTSTSVRFFQEFETKVVNDVEKGSLKNIHELIDI